ncbi:MAG: DUF2156 domain-containing protein [Proteobacteria bacterium]|nr:DUF2156 domain-containing protein [Pseudomonadota bacterium]
MISCQVQTDGPRHFLQPVGSFDAETQGNLIHAFQALPCPIKIFGVGADFIQKNPEFVSHFEIHNDSALANYIYRASDLATLAGKFYSKKRNLIAQAHRLYQCSIHKLTPENSRECLDVLDRVETDREERDAIVQDDRAAVETAIKNFSALGQKGILIQIDGKVAAFSIFEPLNRDTAVIHFEKADRHYKGLYQIINQETAKAIAALGVSLINREEDLGVPGLRQAKQSYGPLEVIPSSTLVFTQSLNNPR